MSGLSMVRVPTDVLCQAVTAEGNCRSLPGVKYISTRELKAWENSIEKPTDAAFVAIGRR